MVFRSLTLRFKSKYLGNVVKAIGISLLCISCMSALWGVFSQLLETSMRLNLLRLSISVLASFFCFVVATIWLKRASHIQASNNLFLPEHPRKTHFFKKNKLPIEAELLSSIKYPSDSTVVVKEKTMRENAAPNLDTKTVVGQALTFALPKGGEIESEDKIAVNNECHIYALADGVSQTFVPGFWAEIIVDNFVNTPFNIFNDIEFSKWLVECSNKWFNLINMKWVPEVQEQRIRDGKFPHDWNNDITDGAQTTLIGCLLSASTASENTSRVVQVVSIGDAEFFHFSPKNGESWVLKKSLPYTHSKQFTYKTNVLATRQDMLGHALNSKQQWSVEVQRGDLLVLMSDALAEWLLMQIEEEKGDWLRLLTDLNDDEFKKLVYKERESRRMKNDDVTMLIVPIC